MQLHTSRFLYLVFVEALIYISRHIGVFEGIMEASSSSEDRDSLGEFLEEAELEQYDESFRDVLKVKKVSQLKFVMPEDLTQIGMSKPEQRRYKKTYSKYFPNPYISKIRKMLKPKKKRGKKSRGRPAIPVYARPVFMNRVKLPPKHIISIEDITINKELGMGQFGVVQQGTWTTGSQRLQVAIKCLGHERMTSNSTEFLKEAAVMHSIEHPNIVRLYGVVLHMDSLMLVTELAPLRSLLECLREVSLRRSFTVPTLCEFAEQISAGMAYLESKRLIHRDLAARNILVFSKDKVKISDFGLSRALGVGKDYYQTNYNVNLKLPVAWCAPECILYLRFTSASDVWAFGVTLWEMFTYGFQPWAAFSGQHILEAIDAPHYNRLERPHLCPDNYYDVMQQCWAHEAEDRPKFEELAPRLRVSRPDMVEALVDFERPVDRGWTCLLEYKAGDVITVLGEEDMTHMNLWYGVLPGGNCGLFDPTVMRLIPEKKVSSTASSLTSNPLRQSARSIRPSLLRTDVKRHTYTGKRTHIQRSMISSPQGDVKHTGHVGLDGAYFGDISFLDPDGSCFSSQPPRQIVTPYRPSEDLEQVPLINPNSPSHLTGASGNTPYHMLPNGRTNLQELDEPGSSDVRGSPRHYREREPEGTDSEPSTSKGILSKVRSATLGRRHKGDNAAVPKTDEVHEYHEISDSDDTEGAAACSRSDRSASRPENAEKSCTDFSQSLLQEIERLFESVDLKRREESSQPPNPGEAGPRSQTMSKAERKKDFSTSTMKPMSAADEKTLNTAVAMANAIISKSMSDLDGAKKASRSPNERAKFHFKFPLSLHHGHTSGERDQASGSREQRRNFSEEAQSVPDIQSTLTEESKMAYTSLIEEPTPSTSLMSHIAKETGAIPKQPRNTTHAQQNPPMRSRSYSVEPTHEEVDINVLPLPPQSSKPKLVDKPRHIRKYPLKLIDEPKKETEQVDDTLIYQNTSRKGEAAATSDTNEVIEDVVDSATKVDTNPFSNAAESNSANPFGDFFAEEDIGVQVTVTESSDSSDNESNKQLEKERKDHVSVEDLLEFADQKPCGRQRGVESDEVRIMCKVLRDMANQSQCLEALELSGWNVHNAIKLVRVKVSVGSDVTFDKCHEQLQKTNGDIVKAVSMLVSID